MKTLVLPRASSPTRVPARVRRAWFSVGVLVFALGLSAYRYVSVTFGDGGQDQARWGGDPWMAGDWLINYGAGFVRRGMFGQLFLQLAPGGQAGLWVLLAVQLSIYLVVLAYCWHALHRADYSWSAIALICSPATLAFVGWVISVDAAFRKEILSFLVLALLAWSRSGRRSPAALVTLVATAFAVYVVAVFSWEPSALVLPAILYLLLRRGPDEHGHEAFRRASAVLFAAVASVGGAVSVIWHGDTATAQGICDTLRTHGFHGPYLCNGGVYSNTGAIDAIGWTSYKTTEDLAVAIPVYLGFIPLIVLALVPVVASEWFRRNWKWALLIVLGVSPLYVIVTDWGRWTHVLAMGLMFCITSGDPKESFSRVWNPLSSILYACLWGMPHWMGEAQLGETWWPRVSLLSRMTDLAVDRALLQQPASPSRLELPTLDLAMRYLTMPPVHGWDSWHPMQVALQYLHSGGTDLYRTVLFEGGIKFQYAPTSLLFVEPASVFSPTNLALPMNVIAWLCVGATVVAMFKLLAHVATVLTGPLPAWAYTVLLLTALASTLTFRSVVESWNLGQAQVIINLLCTTALYFYVSGRKQLSGISLAIAALIKPQLALFLLWGLARREWKFVTAMSATGLAGLAVSVARYGLKAHVDYVSVLSFLSQRGEAYYLNESVNGILQRLLQTQDYGQLDFTRFPPYNPTVYVGSMIATVIFVAVALLTALVGRRSATASPDSTESLDAAVDFSIAMACFTMASPIVWNHHYGVLLSAYPVVVGSALRLKRPVMIPTLACVLLSYLLVTSHLSTIGLANRDTPLQWLMDAIFFGAVLLVASMVAIRLKQAHESRGRTVHRATSRVRVSQEALVPGRSTESGPRRVHV